MPPSPALRISPARELRAENHKRGRSFESGILYREKDDDLALFNEVQNKERENFLLQSNDDFDDIFTTKLKGFSGNKLGISIPTRGESSDLLIAEGDKNDYDWLITPPETPLFSSLDDEIPSVSLAPRGRPRSQPVSFSRSSTMEKDYRSGRGSASPHRLSPSPRSSNSTLRSPKPFSATHASPPPTLQHSSPPSKPIPAPRSSSPTLRRMSTGSNAASSRVRGTSPVKTSKGNSASPKIKAWQSNIPGFSLEAPPNLRTSLADRPASYVRGSSPASRTGRQSMSPTASRSVTSSHSKGSVASSGDDDVDSLQSVPRSTGPFQNSRVAAFSKKSTKILSSSAPKRSFDVAIRQMDRKGPPNMFRPLLSSVPSSTFYAGKASAHHRLLTSRNSSITTSSNASSDQGTSGAHDTEEIELNHEDVTSDSVNNLHPVVLDEVFVMDQDNVLNEDNENRIIDETDSPSGVSSPFGVAEISSQIETEATDTAAVVFDKKYDYPNAGGTPDMALCSKCGRGFHSSELVTEGDLELCLECKSMEVNPTISGEFIQVLEHEESPEVLDQSSSVQESLEISGTDELGTDHLCNISNVGPSQNLVISPIEEGDLAHTVDDDTDGDLEGAGISLLLNQSSKGKHYIVQSKSFKASNITYDDFSYVRGTSINNMRSSIGHSSASVSSSVDLGSSKQTEPRIIRQLSGRKSDIANYKYEMPTKHKRSVSSLSSASGHVIQVPSLVPSCNEDNFELNSTDKEVGETTCVDPREPSLASEFTEEERPFTNVRVSKIESTSTDVQVTEAESTSAYVEELPSYENDEDLIIHCSNSMNGETLSPHLQSSTEGGDATRSTCAEIQIENADIVSNDSQADVDSINTNGCMDELLEEPCVLVGSNDFTTASVDEFNTSDPIHSFSEESTVVLEDMGGPKSRSLTLEEATDTILFCSSIVHNMAYEAANVAIDKETLPLEALRPTVTLVGKSNSDRRDIRSRTIGKRSSKSQKARQKRSETDTKPPPVIGESDEKPTQQRIVVDPNKSDSLKPPKLESKCNCTIM
ncbi:hypothetical protein ACJIZ3_004575 [Penstemon smallii]|uniref:Uncharacterized protein n=1 Tax=Penstemon smallii TaxID=265156 RepID=A0ABD3S2F4_9LAMI